MATKRPSSVSAQLGSFDDWNWQPPMVAHVMEELARIHWDDEGQTYPGFAAASGGLRLAVAANTDRPDTEKTAHILHHLGWIAAYVATLEVEDDQRAALRTIIDATDSWKH